MKVKESECFSPMKIFRSYLRGRQITEEQKVIVRRALLSLLCLHWHRLGAKLPELAISKDIPLMDLPFLSDREKRGLALALTETEIYYTDRASLCRDAEKVFLRGIGYGERQPGERYAPKITIQTEVTATVCELHRYLSQGGWLRTDFETLRVCILLYRSRAEWTAEELAIMREGGSKTLAKSYERRFYRADW